VIGASIRHDRQVLPAGESERVVTHAVVVRHAGRVARQADLCQCFAPRNIGRFVALRDAGRCTTRLFILILEAPPYIIWPGGTASREARDTFGGQHSLAVCDVGSRAHDERCQNEASHPSAKTQARYQYLRWTFLFAVRLLPERIL
jgi:hypothetical protein